MGWPDMAGQRSTQPDTTRAGSQVAGRPRSGWAGPEPPRASDRLPVRPQEVPTRATPTSLRFSLEWSTALEPDPRVATIGKLNPLSLDCIPQLSDGSRTRNHEPSLDLGQMLLRDI